MIEAINEGLWLKGMAKELGIEQDSVAIHCDNQSAIHLAKHQAFHRGPM